MLYDVDDQCCKLYECQKSGQAKHQCAPQEVSQLSDADVMSSALRCLIIDEVLRVGFPPLMNHNGLIFWACKYFLSDRFDAQDMLRFAVGILPDRRGWCLGSHQAQV